MTTERAVVAGMLADPRRSVPVAWSLLAEEDFELPEHRWVYRVLVSAWEQAEGDFHPAADYAATWRQQWTLRWGQGLDMAHHVDALIDEGDATAIPALFQGFCERLAAEGAVRRTRAALGRAYMGLSDEWFIYRAVDDIEIRPRLFRDPPSARAALETLARDIAEATTRAPKLRHAGTLPRVASW